MFPDVDKRSMDEGEKQINRTSGEPVSVPFTFFISMSTIYEYIIFITRLVMKGLKTRPSFLFSLFFTVTVGHNVP